MRIPGPALLFESGYAFFGKGVGAEHFVEGVAFLETFTRADEVEGDMVGFKKRQPGTYREMFREVGLVPIGMQFYVPDDVADILDALEVPG